VRARLAIVVAAALVLSCAGHGAGRMVTAPANAANRGGGAGGAAPRPAPIDAATALARTAEESVVLVRTGVLRRHPVGTHLGALLAAWQGWRATLAGIAPDPIRDLEWLEVVGPAAAASQRMMARSNVDDATLDGRIARIAAKSTEDPREVVRGDAPAAVARLDGTLRAVLRARPHLVAIVPRDAAPSVSATLTHTEVLEPADDDHEAVRAEIVRPSGADSPLPDTVRAVHLQVLARDDGGADAIAQGECVDAGAAAHVADDARDRVARANGLIVHALTKGILDGLTVSSEGPIVTVKIAATRDQLEATAAIVSAVLGSSVGPPP
jgi:hypothetical protein